MHEEQRREPVQVFLECITRIKTETPTPSVYGADLMKANQKGGGNKKPRWKTKVDTV